MMRDAFVELPEQLRGKQGQPLRIRFTHDDMKAICRNLTPYQARGEGKVTPNRLHRLLLEEDPDAIEQCLLRGLAHDDRKIDGVDVARMVTKAIEAGMEYGALRRPFYRAFINGGLASDSAEVFLKALDDAEGEAGKVPTPPPSPTTSSTSSSSPDRSDS